jgi:D-aspartate ligase
VDLRVGGLYASPMTIGALGSASRVATRNAVLLGGSHGSTALARSLRRAGLQVWLVAAERSGASFSNAIHECVPWRGPHDVHALDTLQSIALSRGLAGSLLIPGGDAEVDFVARAHARLSATFTVLTPPWERLQWACEKALAYHRAAALGIGVPRSYTHAVLDAVDLASLPFPLVLKPSNRLHENPFTLARAWRVDDAQSLRARFRAACDLVGAEQVVAQQLVRGGGENQLSYAGVWNDGEPVTSLTAVRLRQYPVEFAHTSTHVETATLPDVTEAAERFLRSIRHHGVVEVEFKRDPADGAIKLLDINPRPWNWLALAAPAGIDIGGAIASMVSGRPVRHATARAGVAWNFFSRDLAAAAAAGQLRPRDLLGYASTFLRVRSWACFSWTDPLPGIVDVPITLARVVKRRRRSAAAPAAAAR